MSTDHSKLTKSNDQQGKEVNLFQPASEFITMIDEVFRTLVENTKDIKGAKVKNHKFCTSVHYRNVDEKVLEVRPVINWAKGKAVKFLLESLGFRRKYGFQVKWGEKARRGKLKKPLRASGPLARESRISLAQPSRIALTRSVQKM